MIDLLVDQSFFYEAYVLRIAQIIDYAGSEGGTTYYLVGKRGVGMEEWQASIKSVTTKGIEWRREVIGKCVSGFISFEQIQKNLIK